MGDVLVNNDLYKALGFTPSQLRAIADRYRVKKLSVFGSFVRGEQTENSDIDLLAEWEEPPGFVEYMGLIEDIKSLSGRNVDLATPGSLHWYIKDKILRESKALL